ncbi:hypothetical protein NUW54_g12995 [Trametes sanguinea]|uniref:Uncharacterized protein n=1 Tax=Trametes sanguinea TaxID=158606 RepID=A0ACC1MR71_9APHY|nr:hypothetical protein NUW54_g12995 [Trametes sanguinea]
MMLPSTHAYPTVSRPHPATRHPRWPFKLPGNASFPLVKLQTPSNSQRPSSATRSLLLLQSISRFSNLRGLPRSPYTCTDDRFSRRACLRSRHTHAISVSPIPFVPPVWASQNLRLRFRTRWQASFLRYQRIYRWRLCLVPRSWDLLRDFDGQASLDRSSY